MRRSLSRRGSEQSEAGVMRGYCACIAWVLLTRMLAVADPVATHTGLASPLLAVYYHFGGILR